MAAEQNLYQARTTAAKLRGRYYTPPDLVALVMEALPLSPDCLVIDPACGDGSFLCGALAALARRWPDGDRPALARRWAARIVGFDIDPAAVAEARAGVRAAFREAMEVELPEAELRVSQADALAHPCLAELLVSLDVSPPLAGERVLIVGNPPYVEAKRLPRALKAALKARYPDAVEGAPDLYLYFLHACLGWLRPGDRLAFVLPNKLLVNANARRLRERLLGEERLEALWLATQAGVFSGAAVYPIVLFGRGAAGRNQEPIAVTRVARTDRNGLVPGHPVAVAPVSYRRTEARAFFPPPERPVLRAALERLLLARDAARLGDLVDLRWSVSFHRAGLRERYVTPDAADSRFARRFLGGGAFSGNGEVSRYRIEWAGWWIDYDETRLRREQNGAPQLALFERPKVVLCQNGRTLRAAYDDQGFVLKDTFLCGVPREQDHPLRRHPRALFGLLCSRAVHFFYSHVFFGGHVAGGYLHFLRSFLVDVPLGKWTDARASEVAALVKEREVETGHEAAALEEAIEAQVVQALGLSGPEAAAIRAWAAADTNWTARERVRRPAPADRP